jgi:hypothetical protein
MLVIFFDCEGTVHHSSRPNSTTTWRFWSVWGSKSAKNVQNDGITRTEYFTMTMCQCTLLCLWGNFWLLKTWLLTRLIWPLAISSCFWQWNWSWQGIVSRMSLKFRNTHWCPTSNSRKHIFHYWLSPETFGYTLVYTFIQLH